MAQKPTIPKGTRDFSPLEMARREYIFSVISEQFRLCGYNRIETPAIENLSTLMGKYGEEGDKLLFKILNSGDFMRAVKLEDLEARNLPRLTGELCEKGLRYDLTVPFARYVVQHRAELQMPFKRYQIQPVWRADRPQKGRYREFYQCDADIVGSDSLLNEVELLQIIDAVFSRLGVAVTVKVNNRKVLAGIAQVIGAPERLVDITVAIDKMDKIGLDAVEAELSEKGLSTSQIEKLRPVLTLEGNNNSRLRVMKDYLRDSQEGMTGVGELEYVATTFDTLGHQATMELDFSLARGLNYYTGTIIEVKARDVKIGSITGGGRYDNLTGVFGMSGLSGVGISFGADRIYDVLLELDLYPAGLSGSATVMFVNFGDQEGIRAMALAKELRAHGVRTLVYPESTKMKKQMTLANAEKIPYVAIIGSDELAAGTVTLKNMATGQQQTLPQSELAKTITAAQQ